MRTRLALALSLSLSSAALLSCSGRQTIGPFYSDGCSLFPDGKLGDRRLWCDCCFAHDLAYWRGGTEPERVTADEALRSCVLEKTRDARLAAAMYEGVRVGGSPVFLNWYRWGYGWSYGRGYKELTDAEQVQARARLAEYYGKNPGGYCGRK